MLAEFPGLEVMALTEFDEDGLSALLAEFPASYPTTTRDRALPGVIQGLRFNVDAPTAQ